MNRMIVFAVVIACSSVDAMAYGYLYDGVDATAAVDQAAINAQEQASVVQNMQMGDFRDAEIVLQQDEAIKYQIRQMDAMYDMYRDMNNFGPGIDYGFW